MPFVADVAYGECYTDKNILIYVFVYACPELYIAE